MNLFSPKKYARGDLAGLDSNAYSLLGYFERSAHKFQWTTEEIEQVTNEAKKSNYDHLIGTLASHLTLDADLIAQAGLTAFKAIDSDTVACNKTKFKALSKRWLNKSDAKKPTGTYLGEICRAWNAIEEGWLNGIYFFLGEGSCRVGPNAEFLTTQGSLEIKELMGKFFIYSTVNEELYDRFLAHLLNKIIETLQSSENHSISTAIESFSLEYGLIECSICSDIYTIHQPASADRSGPCHSCLFDDED